MTRAEFERQYQVIRKVSDGAVRTHHAFASTGTVVMVHEIDPAAGHEALALAGMMARLGEQERDRVLDVLEVEGATVIVTRFLLDHTSLRGWLEASVSPSAEGAEPGLEAEPGLDSADATPSGGAAASTEPGDFTRLFRAMDPPPEPAPGDPNPRASPSSDTGEGEPGEFTRLFRAVDPPSEPAAGESLSGASPSSGAGDKSPAAEPAPPGAPTEPRGRPGRAPVEGAPAPVLPPAPESAEPPPPAAPEDPPAPQPSTPGEFTRMFRAAVAPENPPPPGDGGAAPGDKDASPGEFTRVFGAQPAVEPAGEPPEALRYPRAGDGGGEAGDAYRSRLGARGAPPPQEDPSPPSPPQAPPAPGTSPLDLPRPPAAPPPPGEYTRIIQAAERPSGPGQGAPPGQPGGMPGHPQASRGEGSPAPAARSQPEGEAQEPPISRRTVILGLVAMVVLATALVLVFLLTGGDPAETPEEAPPTETDAPG